MTTAQKTLEKVLTPYYPLLSPLCKEFLQKAVQTLKPTELANEMELLAQVSAMLMADDVCIPSFADRVGNNQKDLLEFRTDFIGQFTEKP